MIEKLEEKRKEIAISDIEGLMPKKHLLRTAENPLWQRTFQSP